MWSSPSRAGRRPCTWAWTAPACRCAGRNSPARIGALLRALRRHAGRDEARRCIDYIRRNRHRMRYPAFRAMGLCVGSGVLEAGCKNVVGTRFKRPGMHWSVPGVDAMAALRCCVLSNRLDDFWIRRKARAKARAAA